MAELSLYFANANVSLRQTMDTDKNPAGPTDLERTEMGDSAGRQVKVPRRDLEQMEMGDSAGRQVKVPRRDLEQIEMGDSAGRQVKVPRRTIYFASGETMEEYSTDEEEEEEPLKRDVITVDTSKLTWAPYFWFHIWRMGTSTISVCDYMGEKLASMFGITSPKYQYAIDEYYRIKKEEEEEEEENHLSETAERRFAEQRRGEQQDPHPATVEQPEASISSFVNISFDLEPEPPLNPADTNRVPSPLPS